MSTKFLTAVALLVLIGVIGVTVYLYILNHSSSKQTENNTVQTQITDKVRDTAIHICDKKVYTSLNEALKNPEKVCTLDLSGQKLATLPSGISKLTNLESLYIGNNQLKELPGEIFQLKLLVRLDAPGNQVQFIPSEIENLTNLQILNLNNNQILIVPKQIGNLKNLTDLLLGNNSRQLSANVNSKDDVPHQKLSQLPDEIKNLTSLSNLVLINDGFDNAEKMRIKQLMGRPGVVHFDTLTTIESEIIPSASPTAGPTNK